MNLPSLVRFTIVKFVLKRSSLLRVINFTSTLLYTTGFSSFQKNYITVTLSQPIQRHGIQQNDTNPDNFQDAS
jgi:hypothetical protein